MPSSFHDKRPLGTLLIVSGPSGSGKTTLCRRCASEGLARYSISCTTRAPRPGERDGEDYHFLTPEQFAARKAEGEFLEYAAVHGNQYGTLKSSISSLLEQGVNVVMDIDVQGAARVRACADEAIRRAYADVYIHVPPSELERRLFGRGTDDGETIRLRLRNASAEDACMGLYQYILISGDRESDYARFRALLVSLGLRTRLLGWG
ncbi:MAG: guanylate kinase [Akkermansia sp.]|nr:guanylate kinase [Akkermansia sp.]